MSQSTDRTARLAGLLYLLVTVTGVFNLIYVPGKVLVFGDAARTAENILAHQGLFRADMAVSVISLTLFIAVVLVLHHLFSELGRHLALAMVVLVLVSAPLGFVSVANQMAALVCVRGADFLAAFDPSQRNALAMLFLDLNRHVTLISEVFWGLWLLPLGLLAWRSTFLPRLIAAWLIVNGMTYVAVAFTGMLSPAHLATVSTMAMPLLFGEVALMLWLLVVGTRYRRSSVPANRPSPGASRET